MYKDLAKTLPLSKTEKFDLSTLETLFRVMSYNLRVSTNSTRQGYVIDTIEKYSPDLIGVQEASVEWMSYLDTNLTAYGHVGIGRDPDNTGEACAVFYKKDKFTLLDSGTFWLSETPEECSYGWGANYRRVCTWAVLRNKQTNELIAHFNTHIDYYSADAAKYGTELVIERAKALGLPTVLTGDFNYDEGTTNYNTVISSQFDDSKYQASTTDSGGTYHNLGAIDTTTTLPIDFCFVTKGDFKVYTYDIVRDTFNGDYSSDHFPLYADLRLNK